jgi:hypothetical protein
LLHQDEHVVPVPGGRTPAHLAAAAVTLTSGQVADPAAALDGVSPSGTVRPL